ncbi:hypothetical protein [Shinella granuli]|uniref:Uncharacterized protein n=1 Tax=Shinella granuli TaxID=323621 RepID=A0A4R2D1F6_SHIGR|nr:hypothetical protein [Shinella granuli]TCN48067.1 hypothetical protein EV665_102596 [Shinella granuli]
MTRCDLSTMAECSCIASGVPCKVQEPLDLGTFRGTNHPDVGQTITNAMRDIAFDFIGCASLVTIILLIIYRFAALAGPINV